MIESNKVAAPLVPKVKSPGDTRHFQHNDEDRDLFKIKADNTYVDEFKDF